MSMDRFLLELNPETKTRLDRLRTYPEESSDQLINRLIDSYEDGARLTKEEVERVREFLSELQEGRITAQREMRGELAPSQEQPPVTVGDPQAIRDMESLFSSTSERIPEPGPAPSEPSDYGDIREIDFDRKGRSKTPYLDSL